MTNKTIEDFVHVSRYGHKNDKKYCQFSVYQNDRMGSFHQCSRKSTENIDGFGFCSQHAKEINLKLGRLKSGAIKYYYNINDGNPSLCKLEIESETDSSITIISSEDIIGREYAFSQGRNRKKSQYVTGEYFDNIEDAFNWLVDKSYAKEEYFENMYKKQMEITSELINRREEL